MSNLSQLCLAADITETNTKNCAFKLEGPIVTGDFDRLNQLLKGTRADRYDMRTFSICLSSPGGSFGEGLRIAELIHRQAMTTVVEVGTDCFSACATIFMAGVMRDNIAPSRHLSARGRLGFHAPYLSVPEQRYSKDDLEAVSLGMTKAILALVRLANKEMKLGGDFIKKSLIQRILEKGSDEAFFIRTVFDAARWGIEIHDAEDQYTVNTVGVQAVKNMCDNFHFANMDQSISPTAYTVQLEEFQSKFHAKDFRMLVRNARTKDIVCEIYPKEDKLKQVTFTACSYDYWSSNSFGDCREYRTRPTFLIGKYLPGYFALDPNTPLKRFVR